VSKYVDGHMIYHTLELSGHETGFRSKPNKMGRVPSVSQINTSTVGFRFTTELRSRIFGYKSNRRKTSNI